jgi:two-component sensor histidine kinase
MSTKFSATAQVQRLLRREKALGEFGTFAFRETHLPAVLDEAARVCAECLDVPFSKICRYQEESNDLRVVAGHGWKSGVVGYAISIADETSPQGRAFVTGKPQFCANIDESNRYALPSFYVEHGIVSTVDVLVVAKTGTPFGVLEVDSQISDAFDEHDIDFLTGFANILAEAVATSTRAEDLRKTIARMEELVAEKEILSQELNHRVRNSLHLVYGLLTAELAGEHSHASLEAFRSIALRVMSLAEVFDHLLGTGMNKTINFGDYVAALCRNLPELYRTENVKLTCVTEPYHVDLDVATALGIIITELVNNAYLHAFGDSDGAISAVLRVAQTKATLSISDNGIGFVEVETTRHGIGLVKRLVQQVGGTIEHHTGNGTTWTITLGTDVIVPPPT